MTASYVLLGLICYVLAVWEATSDRAWLDGSGNMADQLDRRELRADYAHLPSRPGPPYPWLGRR